MGRHFTAWVLRSSMVGFTAGCKSLLKDVPCFGNLVRVDVQRGFNLFGLIYDVNIQDDLVVRQLILADVLEPEAVLDQQENRLVPIEISVLTVGYALADQIIQRLPPQPPISLDTLSVCDDIELRAFSSNLTYLNLVLNTPQVPTDELLVAHLIQAASAHPPQLRYAFLLNVGRRLARLLGADLTRLEDILQKIRPATQ